MTDDRYLHVGGLWLLMVAVSGFLAWLIIAVTAIRIVEWLRDLL